jgi:hypothetical protein
MKASKFIGIKFLLLWLIFFGLNLHSIGQSNKFLKLVWEKSNVDTIKVYDDTVVIERHNTNNPIIFNNTVDFNEIVFLQKPIFNFTKFNDRVNFNNTNFTGQIDCYNSEFKNRFSICNTHFCAYTDFGRSIFHNSANFSGITVSGYLDFGNTVFERVCYLDNIHFNNTDTSTLYFENTTFPDTLIFSYNSRIFNEIDFTNANFHDDRRVDKNNGEVLPTYIYLYGTDISKLRLDYIHYKLFFPDKLNGRDSAYGITKLIDNDEKETIYETLLENFKKHGQQESYKLLNIEYSTFKLQQHWWSYIFSCIQKWWWNFGYNKEMIFLWTIVFIIFFSVITYFFIYSLNTNVYKIDNIPINQLWEIRTSRKDFWNRLWFSFMYTSSVFFKLTLKIENIQFKNKRGTAFLILVYTMGIICIAYMANFVLQKG